MAGATICGVPVTTRLLPDKPAASPRPRDRAMPDRRTPDRRSAQTTPQRRGKIHLSDAAKARLLDTGDLSRFEIDSRRDHPSKRKNHHADFERRRPEPRRRGRNERTPKRRGG